jgi:hypothetical protein
MNELLRKKEVNSRKRCAVAQDPPGSEGFVLTNKVYASGVFGSSYEATAFRLASAHPGIAISGLLRYRLTVKEQRRSLSTQQALLFGGVASQNDRHGQPKYRRQSVYLSDRCEESLTIRWNKSFEESSCVDLAGRNGGVRAARESLPNGIHLIGRLDAVPVPYQREEAHPEFADVLFFWTAE